MPTSRTADMQSTMHNDINVAVWKTKKSDTVDTVLEEGILTAPSDNYYPKKTNVPPAGSGDTDPSDGKAYGNNTNMQYWDIRLISVQV